MATRDRSPDPLARVRRTLDALRGPGELARDRSRVPPTLNSFSTRRAAPLLGTSSALVRHSQGQRELLDLVDPSTQALVGQLDDVANVIGKRGAMPFVLRICARMAESRQRIVNGRKRRSE